MYSALVRLIRGYCIPTTQPDSSCREVAMLDEPITIRDVLTLVRLVRDEGARDPLRRLEDVLFDLYAKASV